jgi:stage II sporulation protein M
MPDNLSFRNIMWYFLFLGILFILSSFGGYYHAQYNPDLAKENVKMISEDFSIIKDFNPLLIFAFIFLNNSLKALIATATGFFFGIFPIFFIVFNGYIIGMVIFVAGMEMGVYKVLLYLIPHGILEIPAILLACSYGLWVGNLFYRNVVKNQEIPIKRAIIEAVLKCLRIVFPVLLLAALIETFVTPFIGGM